MPKTYDDNTIAPSQASNPLSNKRLTYKINSSSDPGSDDRVTEVGYSARIKPKGLAIKYCNLFDELNTGKYGPYLDTSDTARKYREGQIDPKGPGWEKNLREQFARAAAQGFEYVETDNPDAYDHEDVKKVLDMLRDEYRLKTVAKNPLLCEKPHEYIAHSSVYGAIVEDGAGSVVEMHELRGNRDLPVWFVFFGTKGKARAKEYARTIADKGYTNMFVTYSSQGEYGNAVDVTG